MSDETIGLNRGGEMYELTVNDLRKQIENLREETLTEIYGEPLSKEENEKLLNTSAHALENITPQKPRFALSDGELEQVQYRILSSEDDPEVFWQVCVMRKTKPTEFEGLTDSEFQVMVGKYHKGYVQRWQNDKWEDDPNRPSVLMEVTTIKLQENNFKSGYQIDQPKVFIGYERDNDGSYVDPQTGRTVFTSPKPNPEAVFLEKVRNKLGAEASSLASAFNERDAAVAAADSIVLATGPDEIPVKLFPSILQRERSAAAHFDSIPILGSMRILRQSDRWLVDKTLEILEKGTDDPDNKLRKQLSDRIVKNKAA